VSWKYSEQYIEAIQRKHPGKTRAHDSDEEIAEIFAELVADQCMKECANICRVLSDGYDSIANSEIVSEAGHQIYSGMASGAYNCFEEIWTTLEGKS
jgi:hypothetical protein